MQAAHRLARVAEHQRRPGLEIAQQVDDSVLQIDRRYANEAIVDVAMALLAVGPVLAAAQDVASDGTQGPTAADVTRQDQQDQQVRQDRLAALMDQHDCSTTGFGPDVIPGSALIERGDRVQHVSFDDGWAVFTGDATGSLLAVCRANI